MKIKLHQKAPKCLKCEIAMKFEKKFSLPEFSGEGTDRGYKMVTQYQLYRCPNCLNLYEVTE